MGTIIACCFGTGFCSFCCSACPPCKGSTSTRLAYSLLLFTCAIIFCTMQAPTVQDNLVNISYLCTNFNETEFEGNCTTLIAGSRAVYRLSFGTTIFFGLLSIVMIRVKTSSDRRAYIHNGFWAWKFLILIGLTLGTFFIRRGAFDFIWMIFGLIGGFLFILVQLFLLIDLVHKWNESWVDQVQSGSKRHGYGLLSCTLFFYIIAIIGVILLYYYYDEDDPPDYFFISFNICLCLALSAVSISPRIRRYNSSCGLLQSSFVCIYVLYFTWSALSNAQTARIQGSLTDVQIILALIIFVVTILYCVLTSSRNNRARKLFFPFASNDIGVLDDAQLVNSTVEEKWTLSSVEDHQQKVYDDERGSICYNYSLFHLMLVLAVLYLMMTLTSWYCPRASSDDYGENLAAFWVKIIATWFCVALYIWSCIAPAVFPNRDFS